FDPSLYQLPDHDAIRAELKRTAKSPTVERLGVLTIDTTTLQCCEGCRAVWIGEYVRSEQCPKCSGRLVAMVAGEAQSQYVIVSEERLTRLCGKLWGREAVGG
ncbi:MAG: hypothetical protein HYW56_02600, partial [Candidatus Harrisonbacteria bacterium]|nr:hypothetical protein [Candidatus Harrisonbacteria bacterium]